MPIFVFLEPGGGEAYIREGLSTASCQFKLRMTEHLVGPAIL